jgi:hypothetical protein
MSEEIAVFLCEEEAPLASCVSCLLQVVYIIDVFSTLSKFDLSVLVGNINVLTAEDKLAAVKLKLKS